MAFLSPSKGKHFAGIVDYTDDINATTMKKYILFILTIGFLFCSKGLGQNMNLVFSEDTLYVCAGQAVTIQVSVTGGTAPYQYNWSSGQSGDSIVYAPSQAVEWLTVIVADQLGQQVTDSVLVMSFTECVWPGDANGSGDANNLDLLVVGQLFNHQGPVRPNAHTNWIGQAAPAWNLTAPGGPDAVHADTDGNGQVFWSDLNSIEANYFSPQSTGNSVNHSSGVPVYLHFPSGPYNPGDTLIGDIIVGSPSHPANQITGLAFSLSYDSSMIISGSLEVDFQNSWLGSEGVNVATIDKNFPSQGQLDIGVTRIDQLSQSGYGSIGNIIVAIDDITGKRQEILQAEFQLENVTLLKNDGTAMDVNTESEQVQISLPIESDLHAFGISMGPNPTYNTFTLRREALTSRRDWAVRLYDLQGRIVLQDTWNNETSKTLNISSLPNGVYLLKLQNDQSNLTQRLIKR